MTNIKPLKWTVAMVQRELGMDVRTVGKRLREAGLEGETFTTEQIFKAMQGDLHGERLRLTREQADEKALSNAQTRGELIVLADLAPKILQFLVAAKQRLYGNPKLDDDEKDKIILDLQGCVDCVSPRNAGDPVPAAAVSGK